MYFKNKFTTISAKNILTQIKKKLHFISHFLVSILFLQKFLPQFTFSYTITNLTFFTTTHYQGYFFHMLIGVLNIVLW